jgi:pyrroloquinoline quinone biosynthesis protein E
VNAPRPYNLVAELTYRCPLRCAYCSNPLDYREIRDGLDGTAWGRVLREAADLGVVHVGLTGGEPTLHPDLVEIVAAAREAGLYSHLVTAGTTLGADGLSALRAAGLRSVQLSFQDCIASGSAEIAGVDTFEAKRRFARQVRDERLALVLNFVVHRRNIARVKGMIELAWSLDAERIEIANTQYHGWAERNRDALLPTREQVAHAAEVVAGSRSVRRRPEVIFVLADYLAGRPKPCMGGWGRRSMVVTPDGVVLPCHDCRGLPGLEFWNASERTLAACWSDAPGMNAFRGETWMREPCRSCPERVRDFGGCRCQAFRLAGDATATDPACALAPSHERVLRAREAANVPPPELVLRGERPARPPDA